jgi:SulP family sulfate permease
MMVILLAFSTAVGKVAMPTLAAILIFAAFGSLRPGAIATILRTGPNSQIGFVATFVATLILPVAAAVGLGVVLSLLLQLNQEAIDLKVVQLVPDGHGGFAEADPPARVDAHDVVVLDVYGSLFYAGSRTLQAHLPEVGDADHAAVVLRLRGRTTLGATFFTIIAGYAARLAEAGGRLYLSGLDPDLVRQLQRAVPVAMLGPARLYEASATIGASTTEAFGAATTWAVVGAPAPDGQTGG